jgi:hypothetical protein
VTGVNIDKNTVIVKMSEPDEIAVGADLEYNDPNGGKCVVKVKKVNGQKALAEATMCDDLKVLKPGKMLEPKDSGDFDSQHSSGESSSRRDGGGTREKSRRGGLSGFHFGIRMYYSLASEIYSKYTAYGTTATFVDKTKGALGFGLNLNYITNSSIWFNLGGSYEMERKLESRQFKSTPATNYTEGQAIAFVITDLNLGYIFKNKGGIYLGVNVPMPMLSNMSDFKITGGMGIQGGLTYFASPSMSVDVMLRYVNLQVAESSLKYDMTQFDGACVGFGYIF